MSRAEDKSEQLSDYLLGEMTPPQRTAFEAEMASDRDLRAEVEDLRPIVARVESLPRDAWEPKTPPGLKLPVEEMSAARPRRWSIGLTPVRVLSAGATMAALVALIFLVSGGGGGAEQAPIRADRTSELARFDAGPPGASGSMARGDGRSARLQVSGLRPSDGDYYEVWLIGRRGLVPLRSFDVGEEGSAELAVEMPVDLRGYESFDVSLEPDDGDPRHSSDSVLRGPIHQAPAKRAVHLGPRPRARLGDRELHRGLARRTEIIEFAGDGTAPRARPALALNRQAWTRSPNAR